MWHKPCRTFHPWCPCIKTRCLYVVVLTWQTRISDEVIVGTGWGWLDPWARNQPERRYCYTRVTSVGSRSVDVALCVVHVTGRNTRGTLDRWRCWVWGAVSESDGIDIEDVWRVALQCIRIMTGTDKNFVFVLNSILCKNTHSIIVPWKEYGTQLHL